MHLEFLENLRSVAMHAKILCERYDLKEGREYKDLCDSELLDRIRSAEAALLLAPVYCKANLEKKHRIIKRCLPYLEIDAGALATALEADSAYLAVPRRARKTAAVQS